LVYELFDGFQHTVLLPGLATTHHCSSGSKRTWNIDHYLVSPGLTNEFDAAMTRVKEKEKLPNVVTICECSDNGLLLKH
jgi:hypothetical protein